MIRWTFELLDSLDRPVGVLDGVTGGDCEVVAQSPLGGSGRLVVDERGQGVDWMSHRVRAVYTDSETVLTHEVGHWEGGGETWVVDVPGSTVNHPAAVVWADDSGSTSGWTAELVDAAGSGATGGRVLSASGALRLSTLNQTASVNPNPSVRAVRTVATTPGRSYTLTGTTLNGFEGMQWRVMLGTAASTPAPAATAGSFTVTHVATDSSTTVALILEDDPASSTARSTTSVRIDFDNLAVTQDAWTETTPEEGHWESTPAVWVVDEPAGVREVVNTAFPVGTFLFSSPTEDHSDTGVTYEVGLLTKMNVVAEDTVEDRYSVGAGTPIIPTVQALIESTGETRIAVTGSDVTLGSALTWEAGTSKLRVINDLLQAAGYWSLWCDGSGQFRVEKYVDPASRPVAYSFQHGESSVHMPDWSRVQDMASVPNRFVAVGQGDEDTAPLVGVALNENPDSPFSFQSRGRWITATEEGVEAESQAIIDAYAARKLRDAMSPVSKLTVTHKMLDLEPNQLVEFVPEDGVRRLATIQRMKVSFHDFTDVEAEWREVQ